EAVGRDAHLEAAVLLEHVGHQLEQVGVVVDQEHLALAALQRVGGDAVVLHELVQGLAGDPAEAGAGDAEALEVAVVEATDDGLLADLANLGSFAGRENSFHAFVPLLARGQSHEWGPGPLSVRVPETDIIHDLASYTFRRGPRGSATSVRATL